MAVANESAPAGAGSTVGNADLPLPDYDDLTVARIVPRLAELNPTQLLRVRDYERRHANRKPVLAALDRALG